MFTLDPLPFDYNSLEPYIDEATMRFHHDKHHQTYVDKLNELVSRLESQPVSLESLLFHQDQKIRNMAGGVYNHNLFWKFLDPKNQKLNLDQKIKDEFVTASLALFGSGWVWITPDLKIISSANQDPPTIAGKLVEPITGIDLWEHAYYLKYQNRRKDYIEAISNILFIP